MHTIIVGSSEAPRSEFIDRLLADAARGVKLGGFRSVKEAADHTGRAPIYIYPAGGPRTKSADNLLGWCRDKKSETVPGAFDRWARLTDAEGCGLIVMDELGSMESRSAGFCRAVEAALEGETPVLAFVRDKDTPFLAGVRAGGNRRCFALDRENAEAIYPVVLEYLRRQLNT